MSITGTAEDDVLNGTRNADVMDGGAGDDILNSGAGDDTLDGGEGDDKLHAGAGDDTLEGGAGDDQLVGGGGSDTFVFRFAVQEGGTTTEAVVFPGFDDGADNLLQVDEFSTQYRDWLLSVGVDGPDSNTTVGLQWIPGNSTNPLTRLEGASTNDPTIESATFSSQEGTLTRYYEDTVYITTTSPTEITASDGHDVIVSFQEAGPNVDRIELYGLAGLSDGVLDALFDLQLVDTNGDGVMDSSKLVWDGGSILVGGRMDWGTNVLQFLHDDQVLLL